MNFFIKVLVFLLFGVFTPQQQVVGRKAVNQEFDVIKSTDAKVELPPITDEETSTDSGCSIPIRGGIKYPAPLFIQPGTTKFFPYSNKGRVELDSGQTIELNCPDGFAKPLSGISINATCIGGLKFRIYGEKLNVSTVLCESWPAFVARKTNSSCNGGTSLIDVGFKLNARRFLRQYQVCFNEDEQITRYVAHSMRPGSDSFASGVGRIPFQSIGLVHQRKDIDSLYKQHIQKLTISEALGCNASDYFHSSKNIFLARGHMAAKADFVYAPQQRATFLFINAAPQWQVFNAGNWQRIENGLRAWVSKKNITVNCWTGVWGVTTLPNKDNIETPLYLAYDENNNGLIPVPKLYFRVVIQPKTRKGLVLIGVNNPHLTLDEIQRDYIVCSDVSEKLNWVGWKKSDISTGYSYACEVDDFRRNVTHLPKFNVSGLLY